MSTHNNLEENVLNRSLYNNKNDLINYTKNYKRKNYKETKLFMLVVLFLFD